MLVAVDESPAIDFVLRHVIHQATSDGSRLTLLMVIPRVPAMVTLTGTPRERLLAELETFGQQRLRELAASIPECVSVTTLLRHGKPHEVLLRTASELNADLICLGARSRAPLIVRALFGSVSAAVMRRSTVPVLILGPSRA
ncbi:MAG TPA: universal stress protein [Baekduia sp.]|nr:universal stress protein [Baekduia sp.]